MAADVAPELLAAIEKLYSAGIKSSEVLRRLEQKVQEEKADYKDADRYADEIGAILTGAYDAVLTEEALPDGVLYYNIAMRVLVPTVKRAYKDAAAFFAEVQALVNKRAGFGLMGIAPELRQERVDGLIERILSSEEQQ